jgi:hypothetical protein
LGIGSHTRTAIFSYRRERRKLRDNACRQPTKRVVKGWPINIFPVLLSMKGQLINIFSIQALPLGYFEQEETKGTERMVLCFLCYLLFISLLFFVKAVDNP